MVPGCGQSAFEVAVAAIRRHRSQDAQVLARAGGCRFRLGVLRYAQADVDPTGHGVEPIRGHREGDGEAGTNLEAVRSWRGPPPTIPR